jgi:hypothetical protein
MRWTRRKPRHFNKRSSIYKRLKLRALCAKPSLQASPVHSSVDFKWHSYPQSHHPASDKPDKIGTKKGCHPDKSKSAFFKFPIFVSVSQLAAHTRVATFILLVLLDPALASILILRFLDGSISIRSTGQPVNSSCVMALLTICPFAMSTSEGRRFPA